MDISIEQADGICTIRFNRPEKKNAITAAMYQRMADGFKAAEADASVRVIVQDCPEQSENRKANDPVAQPSTRLRQGAATCRPPTTTTAAVEARLSSR